MLRAAESEDEGPILFFSVSEFGMSLRELANRLETSPTGTGFSLKRGEAIGRDNGCHLIDRLF